MTVGTQRALAFRCSACGRQGIWPLELFALGDGPKVLTCTCGFQSGLLRRVNRALWANLSCVVCQEEHPHYLNFRSLLRGHLQTVECHFRGAYLGCIGEPSAVRDAVRTEDALENLVFDPNCGVRFRSPKVMYAALAAIQALAEVGRVTCTCGSRQFETEVFSSRITLQCSLCGASAAYSAASREDLLELDSVKYITLARTPEFCHGKG